MPIEKKNERKHELKDIQLFEENGQYYLKLKYIIEDEHRVEELEIPKAILPFNKNIFPTITNVAGRSSICGCWPDECTLRTIGGNDGILELRKGTTSMWSNVFYHVKTIKEKHKEMTLAEIEKKLGYKIKIVAEE